MTDDLAPVTAWCDGLAARLKPSARRRLAAEIAADLRAVNVGRIAAQTDPDGQAFEPRRPTLRRRKGALRRKMFAKLRTTRYLKARASPDAAEVAFAASVERIARVHHLGLRDRVYRTRPEPVAQYPARRLLGIAEADEDRIADHVLRHLADEV